MAPLDTHGLRLRSNAPPRSAATRSPLDVARVALRLTTPFDSRVLAVGGELKSTICLLNGREAIVSETFGDLTRPEAYRDFERAIDELSALHDFEPRIVAHDLHPSYLSTQYARRFIQPHVAVQHHHAHVVSAMVDCGFDRPVVGVACDGVGYGTDGAIWGCEVMRADFGEFARLAHLAYFPLVGGDAAAIETWRPAAALIRQTFGATWRRRLPRVFETVPVEALDLFERTSTARVNSPPCSSLGRVFDGVAFLLGLCARNQYEAEAAIALEAAAGAASTEPYAYDTRWEFDGLGLSLAPAIDGILRDLATGRDAGAIAARFHETIARMLTGAAVIAAEMSRVDTVALSGGCFNNRRLNERVSELLSQRRLHVLRHRQVPCGDAGLSLGQAVAAAAMHGGS